MKEGAVTFPPNTAAELPVNIPTVVEPNLVVPVELMFPAVKDPVTVKLLLKVALVPDNNPASVAEVPEPFNVKVVAVIFPVETPPDVSVPVTFNALTEAVPLTFKLPRVPILVNEELTTVPAKLVPVKVPAAAVIVLLVP